MLPRFARLNLKSSFKWVRSGDFLEDKYARVYLRTGNNTAARVGISTSSKIFKNATDRNRSRRLLSTAIQNLYPQLADNLNIVLLPKFEIIKASSSQVSASLKTTLGLK